MLKTIKFIFQRKGLSGNIEKMIFLVSVIGIFLNLFTGNFKTSSLFIFFFLTVILENYLYMNPNEKNYKLKKIIINILEFVVLFVLIFKM